MTEQQANGSMFLIQGQQSQPELLESGVEVLVDLGFEVLAGTVLSRSRETFQFRPWGRPELTLCVARVVVVPMPDHSLTDRSAAIERQRAGYSAAPHFRESTPVISPGRVAMLIDPSRAKA